MADTTSEAALKALFEALRDNIPPGAELRRNEALPTDVPAGGLIILRDGVPGVPEVTMSPLAYEFDHQADVDVLAGQTDAAQRDAVFDGLKRAVAAAVAADRTLGDRTIDLRAQAPAPLLMEAVTGAPPIKAATISVVMTYVTADPLT